MANIEISHANEPFVQPSHHVAAGSVELEFTSVPIRHRGFVIGMSTVTATIEWDSYGEWSVLSLELDSPDAMVGQDNLTITWSKLMREDDRKLFEAVEDDLRALGLESKVEAEMEGV